MTSFDGFVPDKPGCALKRWPGPPATAESGTQGTLTGATKALRFNADSNGSSPGFDLDGLCTCPERGSCTTKTGPNSCDSPNGVDNMGASILAGLIGGDQSLVEGIGRALHGIYVQIDGYNLQPNDPRLNVSLYNVVGVNGKADGSGSPAFDGNDEFIVDKASIAFEGQPGSKYFSSQAYVNDGTLVARFDVFDLRMAFDPHDGDPKVAVVQPVEDAHLVGRIEHDGHGGLRLTGATLSGRIPVSKMFLQAGPASVCHKQGWSDSAFVGTKDRVCSVVDLNASRDANAPCDALSFALALDVVPAKRRSEPAPTFGDPPCAPPDGGVSCN